MPRDAAFDLVMTMTDVARFLRISRTSAYELLHRPDFPALRLGRRVRVMRDDLEQWLRAQRPA
jgi:excisionase family DNA binding protein